jgi:hypothetical protein
MSQRAETLTMDQVAPILARVCGALAVEYHAASPVLQWHLRESLKLLVRHMEIYVQPAVSRRAAARARDMGLPDLRKMRWADQPKRMNDPGRKIFHFEHVVRVADMVDDILSLSPPEAPAIENILRSATIAWILKEEDRSLPPGRRVDPRATYATVGIELE